MPKFVCCWWPSPNVIFERVDIDTVKRDDLVIYKDPKEFRNFLFKENLNNSAVVLMSSGNYGGLDFEEIKGLI